jgi:hypothetical protein
MKFQFFTLPVHDNNASQLLNSFCSQHRITQIEKHFVADAQCVNDFTSCTFFIGAIVIMLDYIHANPVKLGELSLPVDWNVGLRKGCNPTYIVSIMNQLGYFDRSQKFPLSWVSAYGFTTRRLGYSLFVTQHDNETINSSNAIST